MRASEWFPRDLTKGEPSVDYLNRTRNGKSEILSLTHRQKKKEPHDIKGEVHNYSSISDGAR